MTYTGQNIDMYAGDSKYIDVTTLDADNGGVLDITGCSITYIIYKQSTKNIVITKTVGSGITLTDPSNGRFRITLSPSDTQSMKGIYNHEAELVDLSSNISTLFTGYFKVFSP